MFGLFKRFLRERRGALSVELAIGLPLIVMAQAVAFEVGNVLLDQHALEAGVRDAARYLSRANINGCPAEGTGYWTNYHRLVAGRLHSVITKSTITCAYTEWYDGEDGLLRTDYQRISITAEVTVKTPLMGSWGDGINIAAQDQARFIGE